MHSGARVLKEEEYSYCTAGLQKFDHGNQQDQPPARSKNDNFQKKNTVEIFLPCLSPMNEFW